MTKKKQVTDKFHLEGKAVLLRCKDKTELSLRRLSLSILRIIQ